MVFSSIFFLCLFLPVVLIGYCIVPLKWRNLWLFLASLFFYGFGEPKYITILLFSTVFDYCNGRGIARLQKAGNARGAKAVLVLSIVGNLCILGFFKYTDLAIQTVNQLTGADLALRNIALPIGISFYTFQTMSYTIDVYRGRVQAQKNFIDFGTYVTLFPQLIAGPIVRYQEVEQQMSMPNRRLDSARMAAGLQRFMLGLGKKVLLANQAGALWDTISGMDGMYRTAGLAWLGALAYLFHIYFDFSGYSDMAIGLGKIFGFDFPENFDHPYEAASITEFWRKWHMTLSGWFRDYVYIPLGGNRKGFPRQVLNLLIVWGLTGLWHGAAWNFLLWGLYYFVWLLIEKIAAGRYPAKNKKQVPFLCVLRHVITLLIVLIGWVLFATDSLHACGEYLKSMFTVTSGSNTVFSWMSYGILMLLCAVGATRLPAFCGAKICTVLEKRFGKTGSAGAAFAFAMAILFLSICFLIGDSYNPFLYFRF